MNHHDTALTLLIDGRPDITVVRATIEEGLSELTRLRLEIAVTDLLEVDDLARAAAVVALESVGERTRRWTTKVAEISPLGAVDGSFRYRVELREDLWFLGLTLDTRKFRNQSAQAVASRVLDEQGVAHRWELSREPEVRKYCVQYRESRLAFLSRLLEFEGIYFRHDEDGTLVLADRVFDEPLVEGYPVAQLIDIGGAAQWGAKGLHRCARGRRVASGAATVNDHNWKHPEVKLLASRTADEDGELEIYDYPVGYRRLDQGQRLAQLRLEALRVSASFTRGEGNIAHFSPGRGFTYRDRELTLRRVVHRYVDGRYQAGGLTYRNDFEALPREVPFRPPLVTPHPHVEGCHTAMVVGPVGEEIHTDIHGRFRAKFHWDREATGTDEDSRWLRKLQEVQTGMVLSRVGWEMSVAYVDGDPDRPIGMARHINGVMQPEYAQPANKTRMAMKSPTYPKSGGGFNELRLEDKAGMQHFDWHANKDLLGAVGNDRFERVGNDESKKVGLNLNRTVGNDQSVSIGGTLDATVGDAAPITVLGSCTRSITGLERIEASGSVKTECEANDTETVTGDRKLTVGRETNGVISRQFEISHTRTVGAAHDIDVEGNIQSVIQGTFTETIGGNKITDAVGGIGTTVTGAMVSTVKGSVARVAARDGGVGAKTSQIDVTGSATCTSSERFEIRGNHIRLVATGAVAMRTGDLSITLTPSAVAVTGKVTLDAGAQIATTGNTENTC